MKLAEFDPEKFDRGAKHALWLELGEDAGGVSLPVLLVRGSEPGKRLVVRGVVGSRQARGPARGAREVVEDKVLARNA